MAAIASKLPQNLGKNRYRDISACELHTYLGRYKHNIVSATLNGLKSMGNDIHVFNISIPGGHFLHCKEVGPTLVWSGANTL